MLEAFETRAFSSEGIWVIRSYCSAPFEKVIEKKEHGLHQVEIRGDHLWNDLRETDSDSQSQLRSDENICGK